MTITFKECLRESFIRNSARDAIAWLRDGREETIITYEKLDKDSDRIAAHIQDRGIGKGDRVVFYLDKCLFQVTAHLAAIKIGAIGVPLNPGYKESEIHYLLKDSDPKLVICGTGQLETIKKTTFDRDLLVVEAGLPYSELNSFQAATIPSAAEVRPEDPGLIIYTSGTTDKPKGAVLTQGNLFYDAQKIRQFWEITERDQLCHVLPLFHVHGLCFALHTCLVSGARILLMDRFSPVQTIEVLSRQERTPCTLFMAVPAMYMRLVEKLGKSRPDFSHIRLWTSGSAPLLPRDYKRIKRVFGKDPVEREGMTETGMNFSNPIRGRQKPSSVGLPLPGVEVRIVNPESLQDVQEGESGEIWLKSPGITAGYWNKPRETAEAFVDGWFRTGDLGKIDKDGYYYLTDRIKHIIISAGENISPSEIEAVINQMEGVAESSVVGIPDERWGEKVVAAVVLKDGAAISPEEVRSYCRKHIHNWKCPKEITIFDQLPRNTMGKVLKEQVRMFFERFDNDPQF